MNTSMISSHFADADSEHSERTSSALPSRLRRFGGAIWHALEQFGRVRARREMLALAAQHENIRPEFSKALRDACR